MSQRIATRMPMGLKQALAEHKLRLAVYPELKGQRYIMECQECGEVDEIVPSESFEARCSCCKVSWNTRPPRFRVTVPASVPPPEDE